LSSRRVCILTTISATALGFWRDRSHRCGIFAEGVCRYEGEFLEYIRLPKGPYVSHTASFAAFPGRALTIFRAGLALNIIGSPLNGFVPFRALVAGFLITTKLSKSRN
jgi:hypothetical protein